jgi:hypothetical protein
VLRGEQRELQAELEAEQGQRLAALNESARRVDSLVQSLNAMHDRLEDLFDRCENLMLASNVTTCSIDGILARLEALEGAEEIPAASDAVASPVASSLPDIRGGDTTTEPEPETGDLLSSVPAEDATMADAPVAVLEEVR